MRRASFRAGSLALLLAACAPEGAQPVAVGAPAPAYAAATLAGDTLALAALRGEPVLLNVWATWCLPCREEMPGLQALHEAYRGEGLRVVAVSIDRAQADPEVRAFLAQHGIDFTILRDPQERFTRAFRTTGVPETFLIDREGRIAARWIGQFDPLSAEAQERVRRALARGGGG